MKAGNKEEQFVNKRHYANWHKLCNLPGFSRSKSKSLKNSRLNKTNLTLISENVEKLKREAMDDIIGQLDAEIT